MARTHVSVSPKTETEINRIIERTSYALDLDLEGVLHKRDFRKYVDARYIIVEQIRKKFSTDVPYIYISKLFNRPRHVYAFQAELICKELLKSNKDFKKKYDAVVNVLSKNVNVA